MTFIYDSSDDNESLYDEEDVLSKRPCEDCGSIENVKCSNVPEYCIECCGCTEHENEFAYTD